MNMEAQSLGLQLKFEVVVSWGGEGGGGKKVRGEGSKLAAAMEEAALAFNALTDSLSASDDVAMDTGEGQPAGSASSANQEFLS